jgi:hypothetical protein
MTTTTRCRRKISSAGSSLCSAEVAGEKEVAFFSFFSFSILFETDTFKYPHYNSSKGNMSSTLTEEQKRDRVQQVVGIGFSEEQAVTALQMADYDVNRAADLIVQGGKPLL